MSRIAKVERKTRESDIVVDKFSELHDAVDNIHKHKEGVAILTCVQSLVRPLESRSFLGALVEAAHVVLNDLDFSITGPLDIKLKAAEKQKHA